MAKQFTMPLVAWSVLWMSCVGTALGADCSEQPSPILFGTRVDAFVIAKLIETKVEQCRYLRSSISSVHVYSLLLKKDIPALQSLLLMQFNISQRLKSYIVAADHAISFQRQKLLLTSHCKSIDSST